TNRVTKVRFNCCSSGGIKIMNSALRNALAGLAIVAACVPAAQAQVNAKNQGYLVTGPNFDVVTAVGGTVCVRTSDWTPARAAAAAACKQCTPDLCPVPPPPKPAPKPEAKPAPKPEAKPAPKPEPRNVELKIELQGIPFNKTEM